jgi:hypothetical protein
MCVMCVFAFDARYISRRRQSFHHPGIGGEAAFLIHIRKEGGGNIKAKETFSALLPPPPCAMAEKAKTNIKVIDIEKVIKTAFEPHLSACN